MIRLKKLLALSFVIGFVLALTIGNATTTLASDASKSASDTSWKFHDIVDVNFMMQHIKVPMPEDVMIIDARPKRAKYDKGHIPMSVSIPDSKFDKMTDRLPKDKNALLIYYCGGLKCKLSHKSARKAEKLGYTNVKVFANGFPGYMKVAGNYAAVSADWVQKQIDKETDMVLIDSRPKRKKYDKGHIPTAISIPDMQFNKMTDQLPPDKSKLLVFYCGGFKCKLSHKSAKKAIVLGYTKVKVFAAGYPAWKAAYGSSAAVVAKTGAAELKAGKEEGSIDTETFKKIVTTRPGSIYLIDVRDPDEFATGSFKTAINLPVDTLEEKIKTLPTDKPIVFVCGTGARSGESFYMVQDLRPELKSVYYLEGELTFNNDGSFKITEPVS
jgi:rhodanese-related sulfurtransferase